ncbi:MAG: hypothetical protein CM15mP115_11460 [Alphaproteobacteria bacterium]|nr:MAG: hypothetical protein CM15mP115_11460 [Alphaproteobacteria bacterium]
MTSTDTPTVMMDKLAEAAWAQLADMSPRALHIDEIAAAAGMRPVPRAPYQAASRRLSCISLHGLIARRFWKVSPISRMPARCRSATRSWKH